MKTEAMSELAINGGKRIRNKPYPPHVTTGPEEREAVMRVLDRGILSAYEGTDNEFFLGGEEVRALEGEWAQKFNVKHAVAVNSATSGLYAAIGAAGVGPGDEVITTPFTMSATSSAILGYNAIPVFCDVELDTYNLDPEAVRKAITPSTKAIMVVHIFGHPADMNELLAIAKKHDLKVIEDAAQAPGARFHGKLAGTIGDIGVYSLNCNKAIQTGEGGIVVTDDDGLAQRLRLIRNHAEAVIASGMKVDSLVNMLGWNYRLPEIEAAIARCQVSKLDKLTCQRIELVDYLNGKLSNIDGISVPTIKDGCEPVYYRYSLKLDRSKISATPKEVVETLNAEGLDFYVSYMSPLYLQPIFQERIVFGDKGCPFTCGHYQGNVNYSKGICPNAESLDQILISTEEVRPPQTTEDMDEIAEAIAKVLGKIG